MISLNLLPEEYRTGEITSKLPIEKIFGVVLGTSLLLGVFFHWRASAMGKTTELLTQEYQSLFKEFKGAQALISEMNGEILPKKKLIDEMTHPQSQWDRILGLISETVPKGIWLSELELNTSIRSFALEIDGYAVPQAEATPLSQIGSFTTSLKKGLEAILNEAPDQEKTSLEAETETSTEDSEQGMTMRPRVEGQTLLTRFTVSLAKRPPTVKETARYAPGAHPPQFQQS